MHILHVLHIEYFVSAMDGDQLVDFYWIDPMLTAERIAAKTKYAGHLYLQFEMEDLHMPYILHILHTVHTSGTWNTVRLCFHIPMDMAIQSLPRGRITVCDILVEMLHAIVMLSM